MVGWRRRKKRREKETNASSCRAWRAVWGINLCYNNLYNTLLYFFMMNFRRFSTGAILLLGSLIARDRVLGNEIKVRREFREAVEAQEKILGIKNLCDPVSISFDENLRPRTKSKIPKIGWYLYNSNIILLDEGKYDINTLSHEAAHCHIDGLSERMGNGSWPGNENNKGTLLLSEGIANYFELRTRGIDINPELDHRDLEDYFKEDRYKGEKAEFVYYEIGPKVVAPILDINVNEGIETLIKNPPKRRDLKDLVRYRERILRMMEIGH